MHQLDISLDSIGYICSRQLFEFHPNQPLPTALESVCHYYDVLVQDSSLNGSDTSSAVFSDFEDIVTSSEPSTSLYHHDNTLLAEKRQFIKNNERRNGLVEEFMHTEISYLNSLKTFKSCIVDPLRQGSKDKDQAILGHLLLTKLNQMNNLGCYNRYLLGVHNARILNEKQMKNPRYTNFLRHASSYSKDGNQTVYDYLVLPGQRIGRYTMMLKELIKHTTDQHIEMPGLSAALSKVEEVANMRENVEGELMKVFHSLLQYIQYCPESLMSYQRRLLYYLDIAEIDSISLKPIRPMTIFLFSDKLMIAKRPSYDMDGLELCGLGQRMNGRQKEFYLSSHYDCGKLKFVGWAHLSELNIYHDPSDVLHTLTLAYNNYSNLFITSPDTDETTQKSLEAYFHHDQQQHFFSLSLSGGNIHNKAYFENLSSIKSDFIYQFGKSRQEIKHSAINLLIIDYLIKSIHCEWNNHHFFGSVYPASKYHKIVNKSDIALFFIEERSKIDIKSVLSRCFMAPNIVGFALPKQSIEGVRFHFSMRSKCALGKTNGDESSTTVFSKKDIESARHRLLGNLLACDRDLLKSAYMATANSQISLPTSNSTHSSAGSNHSRFSLVKKDLIRKTSKTTFKNFFALTGQAHKPRQNDAKSKASQGSFTGSLSSTSPSQSSILDDSGKLSTSSTGCSEYHINLEASSDLSLTGPSSEKNSLRSQRSFGSRTTSSRTDHRDEKLLSQFQLSLHRFASAQSDATNANQLDTSSQSSKAQSIETELIAASAEGTTEDNKSTLHKDSLTRLNSMLTKRSKLPLSFRESTLSMSENESDFSTLDSRHNSTLSTVNNDYSHPYARNLSEHSSLPRRLIESLLARPVSDVIIPIAPAINGSGFYANDSYFHHRPSCDTNIYMELEAKQKAVRYLSSQLEKRDIEIEHLKADLKDTISILGSVCDKFNLELDALANMYKDQNMDQIKHQLHSALQERNEYHLKTMQVSHLTIKHFIIYTVYILVNLKPSLTAFRLLLQSHVLIAIALLDNKKKNKA
ncbi:hypothetical protein A0J61_05197 [Choanephora cucurbitarum]|uniref:DH domain-containing protein n=1 Tax=Choanephora cucurbitarum TaxID=101091 RepID=A0A1C7NCA8_9FUNG|nr:hypothetical protein A0J61_05197 [Choanephora cucurbitarum]